jgi:hypothetical protein
MNELSLQVEDVELMYAISAERPRIDLWCQRLVLNQLEQRILEDDGAFAGRDIAADLERALVGLRDLSALQVLQQVVEA